MKIYTQKGDKGQTTLANGKRVSKCDERVEAYGTIDELLSHIGLLAAWLPEDERPFLYQIQRHLFGIGVCLAQGKSSAALPCRDAVKELERVIDELTQQNGGFTGFVLPGGAVAASQAEVCRTVCRRTERRIWKIEAHFLSDEACAYVNRLSDYFFLLARKINNIQGVKEQKMFF